MKQINNVNDTARKIYRESVGEEENINAKGVLMGDSPNLWPDNNPSPYTDTHTPSEKFAPISTIYTSDDSIVKRILKYIGIGLLVAFIIYVFILICSDVPQTLFYGDSGKGHFFR